MLSSGNANVKLDIGEDGALNYEKKGSTTKTVTGKLSQFRGDDLEINALVTVKLAVQKPPHKDGIDWKMTVEGDELTRESANAQLEKDIRADAVKKTMAVKDVTCPDQKPPFDCELITVDGTKAPVHVKRDGNMIKWQIDAVLLNMKILEPAIVDFFAKRGQKVTADCGVGDILVKHVGDEFECKATAGPKLTKVKVTVKDQDGNVDFVVQR